MKKKLYIALFIPFILAGIGLLYIIGLFLDMPQTKQLIVGGIIGIAMWLMETNVLYILIQKWKDEKQREHNS